MYAVIIGAGKIGWQLAEILVEEGCEVVVVEKIPEICKEIVNEIDCIAINDDGSDPEVLKEAQVEKADVVAALTGEDQSNLVICLMAKQVGAQNVIARLSRLHYDEKVLKKIGIDTAVYPESAAAAYISEVITKPNVLDLGFIGKGSAEILEVKVKENSRIIGRKIGDIKLPDESNIIAVVEKGKITVPRSDRSVKLGNSVHILAPHEKIEKIKKMV